MSLAAPISTSSRLRNPTASFSALPIVELASDDLPMALGRSRFSLLYSGEEKCSHFPKKYPANTLTSTGE